MFQVEIFIALQPLSIFEFIFLRLPYAPAMPTATVSEQWKSTLVVFACSKKWGYGIALYSSHTAVAGIKDISI